MKLYVNGEPREVEPGITLAALLEHLGVSRGGTAVELNQAIVRRSEHASTQLAENDRVEIVTFVGGG